MRYQAGDTVKVVACTHYMATDRFLGQIGQIAKVDNERGYWLQFPGKDSLLFFEEPELAGYDWYPYEYYPEEVGA